MRLKPMITGRLLLLMILLSTACQALSAPAPTATATASPTLTATASPSATTTATATLTPTATATATLTSSPTATTVPSMTPTPSVTPLPEIGFVYDNWSVVDIPDSIRNDTSIARIAFINQNDRDGIGDVRTPQPATNKETLYFGSATSPGIRTPILQLDASTQDQVYLARPGNAAAYFQDDPGGSRQGLYIADLSVGVSGRVLPIDSLVQRGFFSEPVWSPDGSQLAIALATGYAMDIFTISRDGASSQNLTHSGAYDLWPSWSPNGRYLLFVSDRARCPSWIPGDAGACDALTDPPPTGGNPFVLDLQTQDVHQLSDQWLTEAPYWINSRLVAYGSGEPAFGDPERVLWVADVVSGQERAVRLQGGPAQQVNLDKSWSPDGTMVVFQDASGTSNPVVLMDANGNLVGRQEGLNLPRFGMAVTWAPDSSLVAIGGQGGNCPFGVRVLNTSFSFVATGNPPPSMCDPVYSPDGTLLAFTGVNPRIDGRVDIYIANGNGFSATNLTGDLRGQIHLLGWVGGA